MLGSICMGQFRISGSLEKWKKNSRCVLIFDLLLNTTKYY